MLLPQSVIPDDQLVIYQTGYEGHVGVSIHELTLPAAVKRLYMGYNPDIPGTFGRICAPSDFGLVIVMAWRAMAIDSWMPLWFGTDQAFALLAEHANWGDVLFFQMQAEGRFANLEEYFQ